jgi:hypothetical protein
MLPRPFLRVYSLIFRLIDLQPALYNLLWRLVGPSGRRVAERVYVGKEAERCASALSCCCFSLEE